MNNFAIRNSAWNNPGRSATQQSTVQMTPNVMLQHYPAITTVPPLPQQQQAQPQQQHQKLPSASNRKRTHAIQIINPDTGQVVLPDGDKSENDASASNQSENKVRVSPSISQSRDYATFSPFILPVFPFKRSRSLPRGATL